MRLQDLMPVALLFVVATIAISIGADIVGSVRDDQTANSYERNVSTNGLEGLAELGDWIPTLALVTAAAIVIGVLVYSFAFGRN